MGRAIVIRIQPQDIAQIVNSKNLYATRKTKPRVCIPFKFYIYCVKTRKCELLLRVDGKTINGNGKIVGEAVCNKMERYNTYDGQKLYGMPITDLKIYDKPKELSEFGLTKPPQSWCYVEERL